MNKFNYNQYEIAYTYSDNNKPHLVILNGILMNINSWNPFVESLEKYFNVIRLDFIDQVFSTKATTDYKLEDQALVVKSLLDELNVTNYNLIGISYGSHVALNLALLDNRIEKMLIFNALSYTNDVLKEIGDSWIEAAKINNANLFYKLAIPTIYSKNFYEANIEWFRQREKLLIDMFDENYLNAAIRLINSSRDYDLRAKLNLIKAKTMVVGCDEDILTPSKYTYELSKMIGASYIEIKDCGHATMYEKPDEFLSIVIGFFIIENISIL